MTAKKSTISFLSVALVLTLVLAGCTGQGGSETETVDYSIPSHPDADTPNLPDNVKETIQSSLSEDAKINAYAIRIPDRKVVKWYRNKLSGLNYTEEATINTQEARIFLWKNGNRGVFLNMPETRGATRIIVVQDSWSDMKHVRERAQ